MWVTRAVAAPPERVWDLLVDLRRWPEWGPSVRGATLDDGGTRLTAGATGHVRAVVGPALPFTVTTWDDGRRWAWRVAGVSATAHRVDALGGDRCRVGFRVPAWAPAYAVVCAIALRRIEALALAG